MHSLKKAVFLQSQKGTTKKNKTMDAETVFSIIGLTLVSAFIIVCFIEETIQDYKNK